MKRLIEKIVFSGLVTAWRFATWPTRRSPLLEIATTEGVVRAPSALGITTGSPPSITAIHEFVVPRSIPITFGTVASYLSLFLLSIATQVIWLFLFVAVHLCQQLIHHICHVTHDRDGAII